MPRHLAHLAPIGALAVLLAPIPAQTDGDAPTPVTLVSRAEALLGAGDGERATVLLWRALDALRGREGNAVEDATRDAARTLLAASDPHDEERRKVFAEVAGIQADLAKRYRVKKWYTTASGRLDVAELYDPEVAAKERATLAGRTEDAAPKRPAGDDAARADGGPTDLLRRGNAEFVNGDWVERDDYIEAPPMTPPHKTMVEWICEATHEDHEIVVDIEPLAPKERWNAAIGVGQGKLPGTSHFSGLRCYCEHYPQRKQVRLFVWHVIDMELKRRVDAWVPMTTPGNGRHRFSVRVNGASLSMHFDDQKPATLSLTEPIRGHVALLSGIDDIESCGVRFRGLRVEPLPADQPSDEELRQKAAEARQHAITAAVERARTLLEAREKEPAALELREALRLLDGLPAGVLRTNLHKSIVDMLRKADANARRREAAAASCAEALAGLAATYREAGRARCALVMARHAAAFDPDGAAAHVEAAEEAVAEWNLAQLRERKAELAPPDDDGATLRDWFLGGRLLDSRARPWIVEGASARSEQLAETSTMWSPKAGKTLMAGTFGGQVRLPAPGACGGFCFDAAGPHDFAVAFLRRDAKELRLIASRWASGKWRELASKRLEMDEWRLDAWHEITVESSPRGVRVKAPAFDAELVLQRAQLGDANGRIGLLAGNTGSEPLTVELRGFHVKTP